MPHKRAKQSVRSADRKSKGSDLPPKTQDVLVRDMPKGAMRILNAAKVQEDYNRRKRERKRLLDRNSIAEAPAKSAKDGESIPLRIKVGEKMADFSRRVERAMAADVHATFKATNNKRKRKDAITKDDKGADETMQRLDSAQKAAKRSEQEPDSRTLREERMRLQARITTASSSSSGANDVDRDWKKLSQRKSVNDVVEAPPTITRVPRGQNAEALQRKAELKRLLQNDNESAAVAPRNKARLPEPVRRETTAATPPLGFRRQAELEQERDKAVRAYRNAKERRLHEAEKQKSKAI